MSDLPGKRFGFHHFFAYTRLKFLGPLEVEVFHSAHLRWACWLSCSKTRTSPFALCHPLNIDSCLLPIQLFIFYRRVPNVQCSGNGTKLLLLLINLNSWRKS